MHLSNRFHSNCRVHAVATAALFLSVAGTAIAGSFALKVSNAQITLPLLYPGQSTALSYTIGGASTNVTGGLVDVKIQFVKGTDVVKTITIPAGTTGAVPGANTVTINAADVPSGGPYTVRIIATGGTINASTWTQVSSATDPYLQFGYCRGVDVNRIVGSPTYGRIYVTEGTGSTMSLRSTVEGLYILNPDLTPAFPGPKATNNIINTIPGSVTGTFLGPWGGTDNSPFRPYVCPDGSLLLPDSSDGHCALFSADANGDNVKPFFAYPYPLGGSRDNNLVFDAIGNSLYGSVAAVWIEGTGASKVLYAAGEDVSPGNSLQKYAVGTGTQDLAIVPEAVAPSFVAGDWYMDFVRDSAGNFYVVSYSADNAVKLDASGNVIATLPSTGASYLGICIDEARDEILIAANNGTVYKTSKAFGSVTPLFTGLGNNVRDVAIDGEHWIYALNSSDEQLHVWAPAGAYPVPNGTQDCPQTLTVIGNPTPGDVSPVGPAGLFTGPNGGKFGDGKVDLNDAVYVLRIAAGLNMVP